MTQIAETDKEEDQMILVQSQIIEEEKKSEDSVADSWTNENSLRS